MTSNAYAESATATALLPRGEETAVAEQAGARAAPTSGTPICDMQLQLLDALQSGIIVTDSHSTVLSLNRAARQLTGWSEDTAVGKSVTEVLRLDAAPGPRRRMEDALFDSDDERAAPVELTARDGLRHPVEIRTSSWIGGPAGECVIYEIRDVAASVRRTERLMHEATHDSLTGLINRREIRRRLYDAMNGEESAQHILAMLDLDGFKRINDECGHLAGDKVLHDIAVLLQNKMRKADSVARLGGDEFALLLIGCSLDEALRVSGELCAAIRNYDFDADGRHYRITASIGLTCVGEAAPGVAALMHEADAACYRAKGAGGDRVCVHDAKTVASQYVFERHRWDTTLNQAGDDTGLVLYCQAIRALGSDVTAPTRYTTQLKMRTAQGGLANPDQFMPAALRGGIALKLDHWMVSQTLREWSARPTGHASPPIECFIALSRAALEDSAATAGFIERQLARYNVAPGTLCLELMQRDAAANWPAARQLIERLRVSGVRFCLSDFSVGLHSFANLKGAGVDYIKLPVETVIRDPGDAFDTSVMHAIVNVARSLDMDVIGVGIQNAATLCRLEELGVQYAQGDILAEPVMFSAALRQGAAGVSPANNKLTGDSR